MALVMAGCTSTPATEPVPPDPPTHFGPHGDWKEAPLILGDCQEFQGVVALQDEVIAPMMPPGARTVPLENLPGTAAATVVAMRCGHSTTGDEELGAMIHIWAAALAEIPVAWQIDNGSRYAGASLMVWSYTDNARVATQLTDWGLHTQSTRPGTLHAEEDDAFVGAAALESATGNVAVTASLPAGTDAWEGRFVRSIATAAPNRPEATGFVDLFVLDRHRSMQNGTMLVALAGHPIDRLNGLHAGAGFYWTGGKEIDYVIGPVATDVF